MLRNGRRNLFFTVISNKVVLEAWINNKYWLQMMNILSLHSLSENVRFRAGLSSGDFRELSLDIVGEATKFLDID